jgi:predicted RNA-binding Zn ribbon-like protein
VRDTNHVIVQRSTGMYELPSPTAQQELLNTLAIEGAHIVTGYNRDVCDLSTPADDLSAEDLEFVFVSSRLCLAFCATVGERWRRGFDRLRSPRHLVRWYAEAGVCDSRVPISDTGLRGARVVREAIYRIAKALIEGRQPLSNDEDIVNLAAAPPGPVPSMRSGRLSLTVAGPDAEASALSAVARDAIDLFTAASSRRLRECASEQCGLLFVDLSRPGRRRWCSSNACGGKVRAAAYRQRQASR